MSRLDSVYNGGARPARRTSFRERAPPVSTDPVSSAVPPSPLPAPPPEPAGFALSWRALLPLGLAVIAAALVLGVFDTSARPAWVFVIGAAIALLGLASLLRFLYLKSRRGIAALEAEIEERLGGDEP